MSGATSKDILAYVVEGAAYTTYTMWNIIYGPMKTCISKRTEQEMTPQLLASVLQSPVSEDRIWCLHKIEKYNVLDTVLMEPMLDIIVEDDIYAAYSAINEIKPIHLRSQSLQIQLFSKYENVDYSLKKLIIEKVMEAPSISPQLVEKSWDMIEDLNGEQVGYMLHLYRRHIIEDQQTCKAVANLLNNDNI